MYTKLVACSARYKCTQRQYPIILNAKLSLKAAIGNLRFILIKSNLIHPLLQLLKHPLLGRRARP